MCLEPGWDGLDNFHERGFSSRLFHGLPVEDGFVGRPLLHLWYSGAGRSAFSAYSSSQFVKAWHFTSPEDQGEEPTCRHRTQKQGRKSYWFTDFVRASVCAHWQAALPRRPGMQTSCEIRYLQKYSPFPDKTQSIWKKNSVTSCSFSQRNSLTTRHSTVLILH
jgi:hypothetical protein